MEGENRILMAYEHLRSLGLAHKHRDVADATRKHPSNVAKFLNGSKSPTVPFVRDFNKAYGNMFNELWLLRGEGEMLAKQPTIVNNGNNAIVGVHHIEGSINYNGKQENAAEAIKTAILGTKGVCATKTRKEYSPIIPYHIAGLPNYDVMDYINNNTDANTLYSGDLDIDAWYYIPDESLSPKFDKGDCLGVKSLPRESKTIISGMLYVIDTVSNGMIARFLFGAEDGFIGKSGNNEEYPDVFIPYSDVIRIYKKIVMFRY